MSLPPLVAAFVVCLSQQRISPMHNRRRPSQGRHSILASPAYSRSRPTPCAVRSLKVKRPEPPAECN